MILPSDQLQASTFDGISGQTFIYPSAGTDWVQPFQLFAPYMSEIIFVDIGYQFRTPRQIQFEGWELCPGETRLVGKAFCNMVSVSNGKSEYRDIQPAWLSQTFEQIGTGRKVKVTRRRGFGQYAINELPDNSLGVFFHRGDSPGEGGSNVNYLDNQKRSHPPIARVFDKLKSKLAFPALIASDGSNTTIRKLIDPAR